MTTFLSNNLVDLGDTSDVDDPELLLLVLAGKIGVRLGTNFPESLVFVAVDH